MYPGPIGHQGWCGKPLHGAADIAAVAISTKYIAAHGQSPYSDYCGKCMCITINDVDKTSNNQVNVDYSPYVGKTFKGRVMDQCPECEDDHIDILVDRPYTNIVPESIMFSVGVWTTEWRFIDCQETCDMSH